MTNKNKNQSPILENQKLSEGLERPLKIIEALTKFYEAVKEIETAYDHFFKKLCTNMLELDGVKNKLAPGRAIWHLEELGAKLPIILLAAVATDTPQYLQFENCVVEIRKPESGNRSPEIMEKG